MDKITQLIRSEIKKQYKSVRKFSEKSGIPYSTLSNALSKGVGGTSYDTVIKICNLLGLKQVHDTDSTVSTKHSCEICSMLDTLDEDAAHNLKSILRVEYERCNNNKNPQEGLSIVGKSLYFEEINV